MDQPPSVPRRRVDVLRALLAVEGPLDTTPAELARFAWDGAEDLVVLTRADALHVLHGYRSGRIAPEVVVRWADAIEVRDDIGREPGYEDELTQFLFVVATPEINGPFTPDVAERWAAVLSAR